MHKMARTVAATILVVGVLTTGVPAEQAERSTEAIRQEIEAAQAKIVALEREAAAAEQRKAEEQELIAMQEAAKERIAASKDELTELAKPVEGDAPSPAARAQRDARHAHVSLCNQIDGSIMKLQGSAKLPEAKALLLSRDLAETRWAMVTAPRVDRAVRIEALQQSSQTSKKAREKLAAIQKLHEQDMKDSEAEFALRKQRAQADAEMNRLFIEADAAVASGE